MRCRISVAAPPPDLEEMLAKTFPRRPKNVFYAWGDTILNPSGIVIPPMIVAHEMAHMARQRVVGLKDWWAEYLMSQKFRYDEEVIGHAHEFVHEMGLPSRDRHKKRQQIMERTVRRLIAPFYEYGEYEPNYRTAERDLKRAIANINYPPHGEGSGLV